MIHPQDLDPIGGDSVWHDKRRPGQHSLACTLHAFRPAEVGFERELVDQCYDALNDRASGFGVVVIIAPIS